MNLRSLSNEGHSRNEVHSRRLRTKTHFWPSVNSLNSQAMRSARACIRNLQPDSSLSTCSSLCRACEGLCSYSYAAVDLVPHQELTGTATQGHRGALLFSPRRPADKPNDFLNVGGQNYDGVDCPEGVELEAGSMISWLSDGSLAGDGWEICVGAR